MGTAKTNPVFRMASHEFWVPLLAEMRHSLLGCAVTGSDGLIVGRNLAWNSVLGRPKVDGPGKTINSLLQTAAGPVDACAMLKLLESAATDAYEFAACPSPPGDIARSIAVSVGRLELAAAAPRFLWQIVDATRQDFFEERARQFEQVFENSGESIVVKDLNAVVTFWNSEATLLYGFTSEEAVGRTLRDLHAAELSEEEYAQVLARVRAGKPTSTHGQRRKKNGEVVRVAIKTTPLFDANGVLIGETTISRDVTAMHRTEEALRAAQATLEAKLKAINEANRNLKREMASRRKAEDSMRSVNETLGSTINQLESVHRDGEALSRMAELLQSCADRDEAYSVVRETAGNVFPGVYGTLYIYRESRDVLEPVATWGGESPAEPTLSPEDCWALRLGRPHIVVGLDGIRCRHVHDGAPCYVCMPVQGQGQVLGLLYLALDVGRKTQSLTDATEGRLRALADRIGPALANLKLRDSLRVLALHDGLTGLYNRRYLDDALLRELRRYERSRKPLSLIMIDIDHFKRFNDTFGHDAGDFVLSAVAKIITSNIRPTDIACRYGGEELAVLLPEANLECALNRAAILHRAMREMGLTHRGQTLPAPTASFGVAEFPLHGAILTEFVKAADRALYHAKEAGRDRVCAAEVTGTELQIDGQAREIDLLRVVE
jgi:diguanylate cyclase (GGDEF)-like protein/PAS domain S-box-containing protein